jgi:hypothetical protein
VQLARSISDPKIEALMNVSMCATSLNGRHEGGITGCPQEMKDNSQKGRRKRGSNRSTKSGHVGRVYGRGVAAPFARAPSAGGLHMSMRKRDPAAVV